MTAFAQIQRLAKRCEHFVPFGRIRHDGLYLFDEIEPVGMGVAAHNYALMQSLDDTYTERLCWLDACAASFNRYIDAHPIKGDRNAMRCLRWWRRQVFFAPSRLTTGNSTANG